MDTNKMFKFSLLVASSVLFSKMAFAAIDTDAEVVELRTSCTENGSPINNCFTDLGTLNTWIWSTRKPSATSPLKVNIGPGTFEGQFRCTDSGHVTLNGSGMGNTIIQAPSSPVSTTRCVDMVFDSFTLKNYGTLFGTKNEGGSTTWNNMELIGLGYAWFDTPGSCGSAPGKHYWFNSKITAEKTAAGSTTAYFNACDESWFYGSEIVAKGSSNSSTPIRAVGGEVHVYGSVIRAIPDSGAIMSEVTAVTATSGAEIHIHGTGIDVITDAANDITALKASNNGSIHASASSYVLITGEGGTKTRLSESGGKIMAPFSWNQDTTPPDINTVDGADSVVVFNPAASGETPHLLIYSSNCTSNWFEVNTNSCY